jgi:hypothetical protein
MFSIVRVFLCCMIFTSYAFSITPSEAVTLPCVFEDFTNTFGDKKEQNALGAAKGVIENGEGKAYLGGGYWYGTCDGGSSVVNGEGGSAEGSKVKTAIDDVEGVLHVIMTTSTSEEDYPYAAVGSNAADESEDVDVSAMQSLEITAKGSGTMQVKLVTRDYLEAPADYRTWGYYGVEIDLTATEKTYSFTVDDIVPDPYSYGDEEGLTFEDDGASALNKIEFKALVNVDDGIYEDVELYLYKVEFGGMTYGDCGFEMVGLSGDRFNTTGRSVNALTIAQSEINYSIAQPQQLSIGLFTAAGSQVARLFNGNVTAGSHAVSLNNISIASGNYFVVVKGEQVSLTRPFTIIK